MKTSLQIAVLSVALMGGAVSLGAQAPKAAAPKPPAPAPARPRAPGTGGPAAPTPAGGAGTQARRIVRTDTVNESTVADFTGTRRVAIVAAVGKYDDPALAPLRFTVADASELSEELRRQGYIVHTLLNGEATNDNIRERFASLSTDADKPGTVLFAFAGHGFQSTAGANYLATYSTTLDTLEQRGLSLTDVQAMMKATGAKRSVLLVDACRNVPGARAVGTSPTTFRDFSKSEGVRTLLSTRPGGFSYEDQALQHGIFTHYVIEGLRGKAANADGKVTFEDLASYVERRVESYAAEKGLSQKPFRAVDASGDFLLSTETPLKEEEIATVHRQSPGRDMPSDAVSVARQGGYLAENYVMVPQEDGLKLFALPGMQLYASLTPDSEAKNIPQGWRKFIGNAGRGDDVLHVVVRYAGGLPVELRGRLGTTCQSNTCAGQDLKIYDGEALSATGSAGKVEQLANAGKKVTSIFGGRGNKATKAAEKTEQAASGTKLALQAMGGRSWVGFNLAPKLASTGR